MSYSYLTIYIYTFKYRDTKKRKLFYERLLNILTVQSPQFLVRLSNMTQEGYSVPTAQTQ